jgi:hypothetical protein
MLAAAIEANPSPNVEIGRHTEQLLFGVPWRSDRFASRRLADILADHDAIPPGVIARHGTEVSSPVQVPDLIGVEHRTYLEQGALAEGTGYPRAARAQRIGRHSRGVVRSPPVGKGLRSDRLQGSRRHPSPGAGTSFRS